MLLVFFISLVEKIAALQILLSVAEHHSNLVPWQLIARMTGAKLRHVPVTQDTQELDMKVAIHHIPSFLLQAALKSKLYIKDSQFCAASSHTCQGRSGLMCKQKIHTQ